MWFVGSELSGTEGVSVGRVPRFESGVKFGYPRSRDMITVVFESCSDSGVPQMGAPETVEGDTYDDGCAAHQGRR